MCNLGRAEGLVRRHLKRSGVPDAELNDVMMQTQLTPAQRDSLGLAYYPGEVCHTVTCSNSNLNWVIGPGGRRGFATCLELSRFMGYGRGGDITALRRMRVRESTINAWLAESVPTLMAESCAMLAVSHVVPVRRPKCWRVGSLFAGAFDALSCGFAAVVDSSCEFVAELDETKRELQRSVHSPRCVYQSAEEAARRCPQVDAVVASPSCRMVSRAHEDADGGAEAVDSTLEHFGHIAQAVTRASPLVVVVEQSDGLATHHPDAYAEAKRLLDGLPYVWSHTCSDLRVSFGASHRRRRLLWVGVRVDVFRP